MDEDEEEKRNPLIYIGALFLIFIIIILILPKTIIKMDPRPTRIPSKQEVLNGINITIEEKNHSISNINDFLRFIQPNNELIKQVANTIVSKSCDTSSNICQAKAIFYFVRDNFIYISDPRMEYVAYPEETLLSGGGDCDDLAVLLLNLEEAIGIKSRFVFTDNHVFVQINLKEALSRYRDSQGWINLDPTCKDCEFGRLSPETYKKQKIYLG